LLRFVVGFGFGLLLVVQVATSSFAKAAYFIL
jgi:hypothetical protein